jgi:hypothetical protein
MKEKRLTRFYLAFLDNPLNTIVKTLEERFPEYENFRFKIKITLSTNEVMVFGTKKKKDE